METTDINLLMVDDHQMTLLGYASALDSMNGRAQAYKFHTTQATTIAAALNELNTQYRYKPLHLVFLDIQLPKDPNNVYHSGVDLGVEIRKRFPQTKIMVITTFDSNLLIQSLLASINPEGLMIKSDVAPNTFMDAVLDVMEDPPYYSKTVTKFLRKQQGFNNHLDRLDRLIIYYISTGKLTKDLPNFIPLSLPGIEKRKKRLKEIFDVENGTDIDLLGRAKEEGFL